MEIELKFANRQMISRLTEILSEIRDIKSKLTIPRNTRNSLTSFLPLGTPNDLQLSALNGAHRSAH